MRALWLIALLAGCGEAETAIALRMSGLMASDVGSVQVLVLGGATCERVLLPMEPLDDPELELVAHALFVADGTTKRLTAPADRALVFYADAFKSPDGKRPRVGRGCAETTLSSGRSTGVAITITATP